MIRALLALPFLAVACCLLMIGDAFVHVALLIEGTYEECRR